MRLSSIAMGLCAVFLICDQGYCLFRDDVGAPQVQSAIKMQRAKDEQKKNTAEQINQQSVSKEIEQNDQTYSAQTAISAASLVTPTAISPESARPTPQYKRLTPEGIIVDTPQPLLAVQTIAVENKPESRNSNKGFIFLLLGLVIIGFIIFKQKSNK